MPVAEALGLLPVARRCFSHGVDEIADDVAREVADDVGLSHFRAPGKQKQSVRPAQQCNPRALSHSDPENLTEGLQKYKREAAPQAKHSLDVPDKDRSPALKRQTHRVS